MNTLLFLLALATPGQVESRHHKPHPVPPVAPPACQCGIACPCAPPAPPFPPAPPAPPAVTPAPTTPVVPRPPPATPDPDECVYVISRPGVMPYPPLPLSPPAPSPSVTRSPTLWRLTDAAGTTWTHPDKAYLERFVWQRDNVARAATPPAYSPYYIPFAAGPCASGRCR